MYVGWFHARQTQASASWTASVASTVPMSAAAMRALGGTYGAMKVAMSDLCVPRPHPLSLANWMDVSQQSGKKSGWFNSPVGAGEQGTHAGGRQRE